MTTPGANKEIPLEIKVISRHLELSSDLKAYAIKKAEKLKRFLTRIKSIEVVLSNHREQQTAEIIVTPQRGEKLVGSFSDRDLRVSIDRVVAQMERRLAKLKDKVKEHRKGLETGSAERLENIDADESAKNG